MSCDCQAFVSQSPTLTRHLIGQLPEQVRYDKRGLLTGQSENVTGPDQCRLANSIEGIFSMTGLVWRASSVRFDRSAILFQMCLLLHPDCELAGFITERRWRVCRSILAALASLIGPIRHRAPV